MRTLTLVAVLILAAMSSTALAQTENCVFFSEYIEGSSFNKAVEIYNATGGDIELSNLQILLYSNGAAAPTTSVFLPAGTLANGGNYVVAYPTAAAAILAVADLTSSVVNFNGDDAFELKYNGVTVDVIGQIGFDPGTFWGVEPVTTINHTLTRKVTVCCGDPDGSNAFDPAGEWNTNAVDYFGDLGSHLTDCFAVANEGASWGALKSLFR